MPTDLYKIQIENFYRDVGEGDVEVVLGAPSTLKKPTGGSAYTPARWSLDKVADCFWRSGLILRRVIKHLTFNEINTIIPSLIKTETISSLTNGVGTLASNTIYDHIYEDAVVNYTQTSPANTYIQCRRVPDNMQWELTTTGLRRSPSIESPVFQIKDDKTITVYPIYGASNPRIASIEIKYLPAIERFLPTSSGTDKWNVALSDLLIDGAVMIGNGQGGDIRIKEYMMKELSAKYGVFRSPQMRQNNPTIEQVK